MIIRSSCTLYVKGNLAFPLSALNTSSIFSFADKACKLVSLGVYIVNSYYEYWITCDWRLSELVDEAYFWKEQSTA